MRVNLPITQKEFPFPEGQAIVSVTDLKGVITYCNRTFVEVSGYEHHELLGQPQNLIRHPDMPQEAFRDLWRTIKAGRPWSALVKNRRKNGDHYWVMANVTPLLDGGKPAGYLSVRTKPTRQQIEEAERIYAIMREQEQNRLSRKTVGIKEGRVVRTGLPGLMDRIMHAGITVRMAAALAVVAVASTLAHSLNAWAAWSLIAAAVAAMTVWLRHSTLAPVRESLAFANTMAAGDLTKHLDSSRHDEFGDLARALNQLNVNLQAVVADVRREVEGVTGAADDIASGSTDLSGRTTAQAASLEQTSTSMHQLVSTIEQTTDNARNAGKMANGATDIARKGHQAVERVVQTMTDIRAASKNISEITSTIDEIAFQTNILALNAAVEAARAGDQGRSFAVVAAEVRALAQRSAAAARQIKELIQDSSARVESGAALALEAGNTMNEIVEAVMRMASTINDISATSAEQLGGISQVNSALTQLDHITQQNAALVEQSGAAAEMLSSQAHALIDAVKIFRVETLPPQRHANVMRARAPAAREGSAEVEFRKAS
jgi:aerotaxis receptor